MLFRSDQGLLTTSHRESFERIYDIPDRVIPGAVLAKARSARSELTAGSTVIAYFFASHTTSA